MTIADERGLVLSTASAEAAEAFDRAVEGYVKFRADTPGWVSRMMQADPQFVMGQCLRGYLALGAYNEANRAIAGEALTAAKAGVANASPRERLHVAALEAWQRGRMDGALVRWGEILAAHPTDLLALRLRDTNLFWLGETAQVLRNVSTAAGGWRPDTRGYEGFLAILAFAQEESGHYAEAERAARRSLEIDPANYFAAHALAHVFEMEGRSRDALAWFGEHDRHWGQANNMLHHLWWHRMLHHLGMGDRDAVLACYDANIRNLDDPLTRAIPDLYIDFQNAASLLWRLEQAGVDAGERWAELADKAERRIGDATNLLSLPHFMMALAAAGRFEAAQRFLDSLHAIAAAGELSTAPSIAIAAIPVCEAALAHRRGEHGRVVAVLAPIRDEIYRIGGSKAQRELFTHMLVDSAMKSGRVDVAREVLGEEAKLRPVPLDRRWAYAAAASAVLN